MGQRSDNLADFLSLASHRPPVIIRNNTAITIRVQGNILENGEQQALDRPIAPQETIEIEVSDPLMYFVVAVDEHPE